jgi:hypothetical protein
MPRVEQAQLVKILLRQGEMISALAADILKGQQQVQALARTIEQQGRFLADLSVRLDRLDQQIRMLRPETATYGDRPAPDPDGDLFRPPDAETTEAVLHASDMSETVRRDIAAASEQPF